MIATHSVTMIGNPCFSTKRTYASLILENLLINTPTAFFIILPERLREYAFVHAHSMQLNAKIWLSEFAVRALVLSSSEEYPPNKIVKRREWAKKYRQIGLFNLDEDGELWFNSI